MSELLLPWEKKLVFEDGNLIYFALMRLAFLIYAICRDYFNESIIKNLAIGSFFIICVSIKY